MTKHLTISLAFFITLTTVVIAQVNQEALQLSPDLPEQVITATAEGIFPTQVTLVPTSTQVPTGNQSHIIQVGQFNEAYANQEGTANSILIRQYGRGNQSDIAEEGDHISSTITQLGQDNTVFQELGDSHNSYHILQRGYDHEVIDRGFSPDNPGYTIRQQGLVGMRVIIRLR